MKVFSKIDVVSSAVGAASEEPSVFWDSKVLFQPFDDNSSDLVGLFPISIRPHNMLHCVMLNANHEIGRLLERALCLHAKLSDGNAKDQLDDLFFGFDLMKYGYSDYKGNRFEMETPPWIVRYCRTSAQLGVVSLSPEEDAALNAPMNIVQARE